MRKPHCKESHIYRVHSHRQKALQHVSFDIEKVCDHDASEEIHRYIILHNRVSFEAGGNAPFIVFNDADVDAAVEGESLYVLLQAPFTNLNTRRHLLQIPCHWPDLCLCQPNICPVHCLRRICFQVSCEGGIVQRW